MASIVAYTLSSSDEEDFSETEQSKSPKRAKIGGPEFASEPRSPRSSALTQDQEECEEEDDEEEEEEKEESSNENNLSDDGRPEVEEEEAADQHEEISASANLPGNDPATQSTQTPRQKYSMREEELPAAMRLFLREVGKFFKRPVNLERQKPAIANSTYKKAQERILCEYSRSFSTLSLICRFCLLLNEYRLKSLLLLLFFPFVIK